MNVHDLGFGEEITRLFKNYFDRAYLKLEQWRCVLHKFHSRFGLEPARHDRGIPESRVKFCAALSCKFIMGNGDAMQTCIFPWHWTLLLKILYK